MIFDYVMMALALIAVLFILHTVVILYAIITVSRILHFWSRVIDFAFDHNPDGWRSGVAWLETNGYWKVLFRALLFPFNKDKWLTGAYQTQFNQWQKDAKRI